MWPLPRCYYYYYHYHLIIVYYVLYVTYIKANATFNLYLHLHLVV